MDNKTFEQGKIGFGKNYENKKILNLKINPKKKEIMLVTGYLSNKSNIDMECCFTKLDAYKHFMIEFSIKYKIFPASDGIIDKIKNSSSFDYIEYFSFLDILDGKQFLILKRNITAKQKNEQLEIFLSDVQRVIETEEIKKLLIVYSHDDAGELFENFGKNSKVTKENHNIISFQKNTGRRGIYAIFMK